MSISNEVAKLTPRLTKKIEYILSNIVPPKIIESSLNKISLVIDENKVSWVGKAWLTQRLMQTFKNSKIVGSQKKLLVKNILVALSEEFIQDDQTKSLMEEWIQSDGDFLIDQFVEMAPKLFKRSFWVKVKVFFCDL
jgi:hypothetical protein